MTWIQWRRCQRRCREGGFLVSPADCVKARAVASLRTRREGQLCSRRAVAQSGPAQLIESGGVTRRLRITDFRRNALV